jgi:phospholipid/cholesterol/gamma-HCH transport system substrate-binding protein
MLSQRKVESFVGLFLLAGIIALMVLAFKVSGLTSFFAPNSYTVSAEFDDIGALKVRSPVKIGGVVIGEVADISLDPVSFKAIVDLRINEKFNQIPEDSSVGILTAGLLGDNYVEMTPMYSGKFLTNGSKLQSARSALILEKLIGQLVYKLGNSSSDSSSTTPAAASNTAKAPADAADAADAVPTPPDVSIKPDNSSPASTADKVQPDSNK